MFGKMRPRRIEERRRRKVAAAAESVENHGADTTPDPHSAPAGAHRGRPAGRETTMNITTAEREG